jgi:hypothetical protein
MRCLQRGHVYELQNRIPSNIKIRGNIDTLQVIKYVNLEPGQEAVGITQQELLRMMLDRTRYCNECLPDPINEQIEYHLRMALGLHEARAIVRKIEKGEILPEFADLGSDGHFDLSFSDCFNENSDPNKLRTDTTVYKVAKPECKHRSHEGDSS